MISKLSGYCSAKYFRKAGMQMAWERCTEAEINDLIAAGEARMTVPQARLWAAIRITPAKWAQSPWGDKGGGFWAVAILGSTVVWYNDIEEGFNRSHYPSYGTIGSYLCNQDDLEMTLHQLSVLIETGEDCGQFFGPPQPIPWPTTSGGSG